MADRELHERSGACSGPVHQEAMSVSNTGLHGGVVPIGDVRNMPAYDSTMKEDPSDMEVTLELIQSIIGIQGDTNRDSHHNDVNIRLSDEASTCADEPALVKLGLDGAVAVDGVTVQSNNVIDQAIRNTIDSSNVIIACSLDKDISESDNKTEKKYGMNLDTVCADDSVGYNMVDTFGLPVEDVAENAEETEKDYLNNLNISNAEDTTQFNYDTVCSPGSPGSPKDETQDGFNIEKDITQDGFYIEKDNTTSNFVNDEDTLNNNITCLADWANSVRIENDNSLNLDIFDLVDMSTDGAASHIADDTSNTKKDKARKLDFLNLKHMLNKDVIRISGSLKDVSHSNVNAKNDCLKNQEHDNNTSNSDVKPVNTAVKPVNTAAKPVNTAVKPVNTAVKPVNTAVLREDNSTWSVPLTTAIRNPKLSVAAVQEATKLRKGAEQEKVDTHRNSDVGGPPADTKFSCDRCPYQTKYKLQLLTHLKAHAGTLFYRCHMCSYITGNRHSLLNHVKVHSGDKPYSCDICNKQFTQKDDLHQHMSTHNDVRPYSCNICDQKFSRKVYLKLHLNAHSSDTSFSCAICDKKFEHKFLLTAHEMSCVAVKPFACHICHKTFTEKAKVTEHLLTHSAQHNFTCGVCKKTFRERKHLASHVLVHSAVQSFPCHVCNKTFTQKRYLRTHLERHAEEKRFSCHICKKLFIQRKYLAKHLLTHSTTKPFTCDICNKSFKQKFAVAKHLKTHSGEKTFSCEICFKVFNRKSNLASHFKVHIGVTSSSCNVCNKIFFKKENLAKHALTHFREEAFKDDIVQEDNTDRPAVTEHVTSQSDVKSSPSDVSIVYHDNASYIEL